MHKDYIICKQKIRIEAERFPANCEDWRIFESEFDNPDFSVNCNISDALPEPDGDFCGKSGEFSVYCSGETVFRKRDMGILPGVISKYNYISASDCQLYFTPESFPVFLDERFFWSSVPFAQYLLTREAALIHASFIDVGGSAVLFSAPSGTGKSTQAELWRVHRGADVINGDKAGIFFENGKAFAGGVPVSGTSQICKNRSLPLKAIVLLSQGEENIAKHLKGIEALQGVVKNIYLDLLAPLENKMCIDFAIKLLSSVPVISLQCTPDERAVEELEKILNRKGLI